MTTSQMINAIENAEFDNLSLAEVEFDEITFGELAEIAKYDEAMAEEILDQLDIDVELEPLLAYIDCFGVDQEAVSEEIDNFSDRYIGYFDSLTDLAYEMEDCLNMDSWPKVARDYFDWEAYGRDLVLGGDITITGNQSGYAFWNN